MQARRVIGLAWLGAFCLGPQAGAATYILYPDGSGDFPTIQAAINQIADRDELLLAPGIYRGEGNRDVSIHYRLVTIASLDEDPNTCMIYPEGSDAEPHRAFHIASGETGWTHIKSLTFLGGYYEQDGDGKGGAILITNSSYVNIEDCLFVSNRADFGGAVCAGDYCTPQITDTIFMQNHSREAGGALDIREHADAIVFYCTFWENSTSGYSGAINCEYGPMVLKFSTVVENWGADLGAIGVYQTSVHIENTIVAFSHYSYGIVVENANIVLECTDIFGNARGDWIPPFSYQLGQDGNISADPLFCDLGELDLNLQPESPCRPQGDCTWMGAWRDDCDETMAVDPPLADLRIESVAPNPFRSSTQLIFAARPGERAELCIYDPSGRLVRSLIAEVGERVITWDGRAQSGERVAPGMYGGRLRAGTAQSRAKLVLVR